MVKKKASGRRTRRMSFFAIKEPGFFGVMEPVFGRANGHPGGVKNAWF